ncbi:hypothetical protein E2C01_038220 [Portunus trituberculatus]|uniref:Uncharacterized protein n=1 Tax=Portunus trituberculatus TaxID=210409 RepID=A0A5B7FG98_PORTR|nr:hypothetical protein [Portunus trituberculatus]
MSGSRQLLPDSLQRRGLLVCVCVCTCCLCTFVCDALGTRRSTEWETAAAREGWKERQAMPTRPQPNNPPAVEAINNGAAGVPLAGQGGGWRGVEASRLPPRHSTFVGSPSPN